MKSTGIVRKIDDLGRIVIPKEIRNLLNIQNNDNIEIYIDNKNIILTKYDKAMDLKSYADKLANITDIINDYNEIGEDVFKRFKQGKTGILKYYDYAILNYKLNGFETFEKLKEKFNLLKNMLEKVEKDNILC